MRTARLLALSALLLLAGAAASSPPAKRAAARPALPAPSARPDLLLITIDTLRADALGFAGNRQVATPLFDRLASQGRVFPFAHAHNVVTLPSHANILTGLYPYQHGIRDNSGFRLPAGVETLATRLKGSGYATGAFVGAFPLDSQFGLDRGFDVYDDRYPKGSDRVEFALPERRGDAVVGRALAWWKGSKGKPRFLWVHLYDPHAPYDPPEPFASRYRANPYLGEVAATDSFLAPLLSPLLEGKERPVLVALTADHGESLGEHGELTHGLFAYEATLRVPLVLWGTGVAPGRDLRLARHVDLFPTFLAAAGVAPPAAARAALPGRSLLSPPATPSDGSYFEALSAALNRGWAPLRGTLSGAVAGKSRKTISLPLPEVYDPLADPGEARNLFAAEGPAARAALAALPEASAWPPGRQAASAPLSAEAEARLRSLGYAGGGGSGSASPRRDFGPEDDPKTLIGLDGQINAVIDAYSRGALDPAIETARKVVAARPSMPLGHSLLVQALLERGLREEALSAMRKARAAGAVSDSLLRQMGLTLAETGRAAEAVELLRPLAETGDGPALNAYGAALSEAGKQAEAEAVLKRCLAIDPEDAKALERLGLVKLRQRQWGPSRDASRRAVELNPRLPAAWNDLGVALFQLGDPAGALDAWQRAVDLQGDLWDALWNLGTQAAERNRPEQARRALRRFVEGAPPSYAADVAAAKDLLRKLGG